MELLSRTLRRTPPPSAALERTEYARRDRDLLWYLLRGSMWQSYTRCVISVITSYLTLILAFHLRPKLEGLATGVSHTPLFGLFGAFIQDWIPLIDEYYYCMCCFIFFLYVPAYSLTRHRSLAFDICHLAFVMMYFIKQNQLNVVIFEPREMTSSYSLFELMNSPSQICWMYVPCDLTRLTQLSGSATAHQTSASV